MLYVCVLLWLTLTTKKKKKKKNIINLCAYVEGYSNHQSVRVFVHLCVTANLCNSLKILGHANAMERAH